MSKFGSNPFVKLADLLREPGPTVAQVSAVNTDGTVTITHRGGGKARVRASQAYSVGDQVFVKSGVASGRAPSLPSSRVSI